MGRLNCKKRIEVAKADGSGWSFLSGQRGQGNFELNSHARSACYTMNKTGVVSGRFSQKDIVSYVSYATSEMISFLFRKDCRTDVSSVILKVTVKIVSGLGL